METNFKYDNRNFKAACNFFQVLTYNGRSENKQALRNRKSVFLGNDPLFDYLT